MADVQRLGTLCVHAGELEDAHGSPHTPIYTTTTFKFPAPPTSSTWWRGARRAPSIPAMASTPPSAPWRPNWPP